MEFLFSDTLASCRHDLIKQIFNAKKKKKLKMQNKWEQRKTKRIKGNLEKVEVFSLSDLPLR